MSMFETFGMQIENMTKMKYYKKLKVKVKMEKTCFHKSVDFS
jgi:hypothetical protein